MVEWWEEEPASTAEEVRRRHAQNKVGWEQAAEVYRRELDETLGFLRAGGSDLHPVERRVIEQVRGPLREWCTTAVHLQCASGRDTLSLWNEGVDEVVGVDISEVHIANARLLTRELDAPASWHACDVLDTPHVLDGSADLVYTGRGAIGWIHDLASWAEVVARLLRDDGLLCLYDDHPCSHLFDADADSLTWSGVSYFDSAAAGVGFSASFIEHLGVPEGEAVVNHDRLWTLAEVFTAVTGAGLDVIHLGEHPEQYWDAFPALDREDVARIPQTFSLVARRSA